MMQQRMLGSRGPRVSAQGLGCMGMSFGYGPVDEGLAETDRPGRVIVLRDEPQVRERYFTVTGRPRRDLLFDEQVAHLLPAVSAAGD